MKINYYSNSNGAKVTKDVTGKEDEIPSIYFSMFVGDHFGNGTGWIELPDGLIQSIRQNHNVEFKGTVDSVAPLPKMDGKGNINTTLPATNGLHVTHTGDIKLGSEIPNGAGLEHQGFGKSNHHDEWGSKPIISTSTPQAQRIQGYIQAEQPKIYQAVDQQLLEEMKAFARQQARSFDVDQYILEGLPTNTIEQALAKLNSELIKRGSTKAHIKTDGSINTFDGRVKAMALLGFSRKTSNRWHHHLLGEDSEQNWLAYDPTQQPFNDITTMLFKSGFVKGQRKVRNDIKAALDIR